MSRELWLLRHGKSDRDLAVDDFDRPLKKRGKHDLLCLAKWMSNNNLIPDYILSSPANRALSTANIIHGEVANSLLIAIDKRLYQEGVERIKGVLAECPMQVKKLLLVGHNPELEHVLINFVGAGNLPDTNKLLPTSTLVRLKMPEDWFSLESGCASLISITYAKLLSE